MRDEGKVSRASRTARRAAEESKPWRGVAWLLLHAAPAGTPGLGLEVVQGADNKLLPRLPLQGGSRTGIAPRGSLSKQQS